MSVQLWHTYIHCVVWSLLKVCSIVSEMNDIGSDQVHIEPVYLLLYLFLDDLRIYHI